MTTKTTKQSKADLRRYATMAAEGAEYARRRGMAAEQAAREADLKRYLEQLAAR